MNDKTIRKTLATGILSTIGVGLVPLFAGMFIDIQNLKAEDRNVYRLNKAIENRLERIEDKNDVIIEMLIIRNNQKRK